MENNITVTFDGEILNIDDNNIDWFAFSCTVGLMTAEDESGESRHDLNEFLEGIRAVLEYHDRNQEKTALLGPCGEGHPDIRPTR